MLKLINFLAFLAMVTSHINAKTWHIDAGVSYADISGIKTYGTNNNIQGTKNLIVPFLKISKDISDNFSLSYRYSYYDELVNNGISSDGNIFNENNSGGGYIQAVLAYRFFERLHENTFSINYSLFDNDNWLIEIAPTLSITRSRADFFAGIHNGTPIENIPINLLHHTRTINETNYSAGANFSTRYKITTQAYLNFNYRYSSIGNKDINLFGTAITVNF